MNSKHTPFHVIWEDVNKKCFGLYDIMPFLIREYNALPKKERPTNFDDVKGFVLRKSRHQYWGKVEYELKITSVVPYENYGEKWNVYHQITMNISIITKVLMDNLKIKQ